MGVCAARSSSVLGTTLADYPSVVKLWHPSKNGSSTPADYLCASNKRVWLQCNGCPNCGEVHEWEAVGQGLSRAILAGRTTVCPACSSYKSFCSCKALSKNEGLLREWHEDNPSADTVSIGSAKKFKWRCLVESCAHVWEARLADRSNPSRGNGCPKCRILGNGLAERRPDLVAEWDEARKNGCSATEVSCGSNWEPWWCCQGCGVCWQSSIKSRAKQQAGCQKCRKKK